MAAGFKKREEVIENISNKRIMVLALIIFIFALVIVFRLFGMQILQGEFYSDLASSRQEVIKNLIADRGSIYSREGDELYPLVTNREYYLLYAEPVLIEDVGAVIDAITPILALDEEEWKLLLGRLSKAGDPYEPIKEKVTRQQKETIEALDFSGLGFIAESYRYYPESEIGGHIFGFVSEQDEGEIVGQYGLEGYFNKELSGKSGLLRSIKDALGSLITIGPRSIQSAEDGVDLVLTIDRNIQFTACQKLQEFYDYFEAKSGSVIIMEPTGAIIAMCSYPDFNPEKYNEVEDINHLSNPAIFTPYEPGSIFKMVTMAAGLDSGAVEPDTTYVDEGEVKVGPYTIKNADLKAHGQQSMTNVLELSLNTGVIFVEQKVGKKRFKKYIENFGFGERAGITLDTEVAGNISSLDKPGDIYSITASYGQGITVTPLQMITAFAAIANKGILPKPYIVEEVIQSSGESVKITPQEVRQVVSPKTASLLTGMLTSVVENGFGVKAKVEGYYFAVIRGTAQVAEDGGYGTDTVHSYVGFGPVTNPRFVILVKLDSPKGIRFSSDSVAPLFGQLAQYLVNYYQIAPDY